MSDLLDFIGGKSFPIGSSLANVTYQGDLITAQDGSLWMAATGTAPFDYTSTYSAVADIFKSPHRLLPGPFSGLHFTGSSSYWFAYKPSSTLWCISGNSFGDSTNGYYYYTSTDSGVTWTQRTFPNTKPYFVQWVGNKFVGVSPSSTTNGIITSTDAVTWTSITGISITAIQDIISDGSNNILIIPSNGTAGASSTDGGSTWAATTLATTIGAAANSGSGLNTWNAGAGLFISSTSTAGQYQTSPTGATWTIRGTQATYSPYSTWFTGNGVRFASNATTTISVGAGGFFATTTDGLVWSNHSFISNSLPTNSLPIAVYYDGTRFVVLIHDRTFYSTNGTTWSEGKRFGNGVANAVFCSGGVAVKIIQVSAQSKALFISDVTATTPATVLTNNSVIINNGLCTYFRIK